MRRPRSRALALSALLVSLALGTMAAAPTSAAVGPRLVRNINFSGSSNPSFLTRVGDVVFFAANDGVHGTELWKTDGTAAGTVMVRNVRGQARPTDLIDVSGTLFYMADGPAGRGLWKSDGTAAGTVPITGSPHVAKGFTAVGDKLFFFGCTTDCSNFGEVWVSDGTADGTKRVFDSQRILANGVAAGDRFYFSTFGWDRPARLRWTDGTVVKRVPKIAGMNVGYDDAVGKAMESVGNRVYLAVDGDLWRTNGTWSGTRKLLDNADPWTHAGPKLMHALGSKLVFTMGVNGNELWVSNGTVAGTQLIYNIGETGLSGASMAAADGWLFIARGWEQSGNLWRTNGTNAGTDRVGMGKYGALPTMLTLAGDKLCFAVPDSDAFDWTLWQTDVTSFPWMTDELRSFELDSMAGVPAAAALDGTLVFSAAGGSKGRELWSYTP